jgi:hypothetical protein
MNFQSRKIAGIFFSMYLSFVFLIVEPVHHHEDNENHYDCTFCLIACLPVENVSPFVLPAFNGITAELSTIPQPLYLPNAPVIFNSRAPPETI